VFNPKTERTLFEGQRKYGTTQSCGGLFKEIISRKGENEGNN